MPAPTDDRGPERFLRVDHLRGNLRGRSLRGGAITITNQGIKFVATLASTAVLARILPPEDFGLIAMVIAIIAFVSTFKDMGLAMATVQRAEINHGQVSTLFWINVGISFLIMIAMAAMAPVLAWFYKEPRVLGLTLVLAVTIIFSGITLQHQALLRRQMRFGILAVIEVIAILLGFASAIVAALAGLGYWSLVLVPLVRDMSMAVGIWSACRWRPGPPVRHSGVRTMLSFGAHLTGFNIVNYFARNLDKILIGRFFGAVSLGLYSKAYQLVLLPIQQINMPLTAVAVPTLSRLQDQLERYRAYYRRGVLLTVTAGMPIVVFLFVVADKAILTLLGEQWMESVAIFRVLAPAAFIGTFNVATGWVYVSTGMTKRQFSWGIFASSVTVLAFFIGLQWGPIGVGAAFSIAMATLRLPGILYCFRRSHLCLADLGVAIWRPALSSLGAGVALFLADGLLGIDALAAPVGLVLDFLLYIVFYVLIWVVLPGGRRSVADILEMVKELKRTPRDPGSQTLKEISDETNHI
jgi:O-antigen/teichoic acid export membrane protein